MPHLFLERDAQPLLIQLRNKKTLIASLGNQKMSVGKNNAWKDRVNFVEVLTTSTEYAHQEWNAQTATDAVDAH